MKILRYISILPAAISAWLFALFASLRIDYYRAVILCPVGFREGADCYVEGWVRWPTWLVSFGAALSATLIIASVAILAPANKLKISMYTYFIGAIFATVITIYSGYTIPYLATITFGLLSVLVVASLTDASRFKTRATRF